MYDVDDIRQKIFKGTVFEVFGKLGPYGQPQLQRYLKIFGTGSLQKNLQKLTDKELAFMRMMDDSELRPYFVKELTMRERTYTILLKLREVINAVKEWGKVDEVDYVTISETLDVEERVVSYIEYVLTHSLQTLLIEDRNEIMAKLYNIMEMYPEYSIYQFLHHVEDKIGSITLILDVIDNLPIDSDHIINVDKIPEFVKKKILIFISNNQDLSIEDLIYLVSREFQIEEKSIEKLIKRYNP